MKTTLRKLISEIDKSKETSPSWEKLANLLQVNNLFWSDDPRLKCYFIKEWLCTDTNVGIRAYFLDEKFVALSTQVARKAYETFQFISRERAIELKQYLESLIEDSLDIEILEELDDEVPSMFKLEFSSQILQKEAFLNDEKVEILKQQYPWGDDRHFHTVLIKKSDGTVKEVDCRELQFEYNK